MSASSQSDILIAAKAPRVVVSSDSQVDTTNLTQADFDVHMLEGRPFASPVLAHKREFSRNGVISDEHQFVVFDPQPFTCDEYGGVCASTSENEHKTPSKACQGSDLSSPTSVSPTDPEAQERFKAGVDQFKEIRYPISSAPFLLKLASTRATLHFNPKTTVIGIVTCGGLCPGLNDVIRSLTLAAHGSYKVKRVIGFRYGYWGLSAAGRNTAMELTHDTVRGIHRQGGTMLGSSRGSQPVSEMVDTLQHYGVNILFTAGGDGTQKGSLAIEEECRRRGLDIAIVGIPKTIDSDISVSHRTFGYQTAVEESVRAIRAAHAEASSHEYGIGVVTLMGRHSGFIAAEATIASAQANICLIPEVKTTKETFLKLLETRFKSRKYCVVVVAEGFGQDWAECQGDHGVDASGNKKNAHIGEIVKVTCDTFLKSDAKYKLSTVKFIDPSYMIRACPANPSDGAFCTRLSTLAVHEAMAGNTGCLVSQWFGNFVLVPTRVCVSTTRKISPQGHLWRQVRDLTVDNDLGFDYEMVLGGADGEGEGAGRASTVAVPLQTPLLASIADATAAQEPPPPRPLHRIIVLDNNRNKRNTTEGGVNPDTTTSSIKLQQQEKAAATQKPTPKKSGVVVVEPFAAHAIRALSSGIVTAAIIIAALRWGALQQK